CPPSCLPSSPGVPSPHYAQHRKTRSRRILLGRTRHLRSSRRHRLLLQNLWLVRQQHAHGPQRLLYDFRLEGRDAAAGCTLRPEERSHGVPPHWKLYVAVDSADASAARAAELGGTVLAPPFD